MYKMLLILVVIMVDYVKGDGPSVVTSRGVIRGFRDGDYTLYLGIPYGMVDRDNPFGTSRPYPKFQTPYEALEDPPACPEIHKDEAIGSLDCLRLNVFAPNTASINNKLPVIVWIYGGAFITSFAKRYYFGAGKLIKHGVIVVTLNYRVGPYGFMCLDTPQVPGNQGFKDQLLAMKWVKSNIRFFGGDDDNITLMGESSGAASIEAHLLSKREKLYDKVIIQSGTMLKPGNIIDSNENVPLQISKELGFKTDNTTEAIAYLAKANPMAVVRASTQLSIEYKACIEKEFDNNDSIITDRPYNLKIPKVRGMKVLAGFNNREGLVINAIDPAGYLNNPNTFRDALRTIFNYDNEFEAMESIVRNYYIADNYFTEDVRSEIIEFQSDFFYNYPLTWCLDRLIENGAGEIYQYMFSYEGSINFVKNVRNISLDGVSHGDELGYLFDMGDDKTPTDDDQKVIDRITTLWTNFAKYGNPTPEETDLIPVSWSPISRTYIPYLNIDSELTMRSRPFNKRLAFWKLFFEANRHKLKGYRED